MLKIVTIPNPVLTDGTKKVERFDEKLVELVKNMDQTLRAQVNPQGVGLASPLLYNGYRTRARRTECSCRREAKAESDAQPRILRNPRSGVVLQQELRQDARRSQSAEVRGRRSLFRPRRRRRRLPGHWPRRAPGRMRYQRTRKEGEICFVCAYNTKAGTGASRPAN